MQEPNVIAVIGAKGGCGATLLASNIAAGMSESQTVCAMDLDFGRGDLNGMLDLEPERTLPQLLDVGVDATLLRGSATHHADGFSVLGQPRDMNRLVYPVLEEVTRLIHVAREAWEVLVLDVGSHATPALRAAVTQADHVLIVTTRDLLAFRNVIRLRALLVQQWGVPAKSIRVALNKLPTRAGGDDLAELAHLEVTARVRWDEKSAELAMAIGRAVRVVAPRSVLAQDLDGLWRNIAGVEPLTQRWHLPWIGDPQ